MSKCSSCSIDDDLQRCDGCSANFCSEHFSSHQKRIDKRFDRLRRQVDRLGQKPLNTAEHERLIDRWENETIDSVRQHAADVREKLREMRRTYENQIDEFQQKFKGKTASDKDLNELISTVWQCERETQQAETILVEFVTSELAEIFVKSIRVAPSEQIHWTFLYELPLSSTYGLMAANESRLLLGWNRRLEILDLNGGQRDELRVNSLNVDGKLCDLTWSDVHRRFFLLCEKSLFALDATTGQVTLLSNIPSSNEEHRFISISMVGDFLLVLNNRSLDFWHLKSESCRCFRSIKLVAILNDLNVESICTIRSSDRFLNVLIQNERTQMFRLDTFRVFPFRRLNKGVEFDHFVEKNLATFALLSERCFLFFNWENRSMRHIDIENKSNFLVQCNIYNACRAGRRTRLVLNAMTHLKIFQLHL